MQNTTDYKTAIKPVGLPQDINVEVFMELYPENTFFLKFCGLHKRNAYKDILEIEQSQDKLVLHLGRNSLYNSLPEYLFHNIDRFDHIPERDKKQKFAEEYAKQEKEKEQAYNFFAPIDTLLFQLRMQVREHFNKYTESDLVMQNILLDNLTSEQRENRFIKRTIPCITACKTIRGNRTLITLLLRKVFYNEGITVCTQNINMEFRDENPRYDCSEGKSLGSIYVGNKYSEPVVSYTVSHWSDTDCDVDFLSFVDELEVYRQFVQDYFLSVDSILEFNISKDATPLRVSDTTIYNYLNFNTNI